MIENLKEYKPLAERTSRRAYYEKVGQNFYESQFEALFEDLTIYTSLSSGAWFNEAYSPVRA